LQPQLLQLQDNDATITTHAALAFVAGSGFAYNQVKSHNKNFNAYMTLQTDLLEKQIDAVLPQTQCQKCGYPGCRPYAEAISKQQADINQCPPGGEQGIAKLAALLGVTPKPLNPAFGMELPRRVAVIREADCIGCGKCIPPCPVDAIIGSAKHMHSVIAELCTGCELCIAPCPVDCITLEVLPHSVWSEADANQARLRHESRNRRLAQQETEKIERMNRQKLELAQLAQRKT